jgi:hypothetical protein
VIMELCCKRREIKDSIYLRCISCVAMSKLSRRQKKYKICGHSLDVNTMNHSLAVNVINFVESEIVDICGKGFLFG